MATEEVPEGVKGVEKGEVERGEVMVVGEEARSVRGEERGEVVGPNHRGQRK